MSGAPRLSVSAAGGLLIVIAGGAVTGMIAAYAWQPVAENSSLWYLSFAACGAAFTLLLWIFSAALAALFHLMGFGAAARRAAAPVAAICLIPLAWLPMAIVRFPYGEIPWTDDAPFPVPMTPHTQLAWVLGVAFVFVLSLLAVAFPALRRGPLNLLSRHPVIVLGILIVAWTAVCSALDIIKNEDLRGFTNIVIFTDALRHIASDQGPLFSSLGQADGSSILGVHSSYIWFLVYPIFAAWPTARWLTIFSNAFLAAAAIPVYLLSRRFFGKGVSLLLAMVFLFDRLVVAQPATSEMTEERFVPLFLIFAFYFWQSRRFAWFSLCSLLAMTVREDVGIVIALIGVLSLIQRRRIWWWLPVMLLGAGWFLISVRWLIPHFNPIGTATRPLIIYNEFGDSTGEIIRNLILHPWLVMQKTLGDFVHRLTAYHLLIGVGFGLPLFSLGVLPSLVYIAETMLSSGAYPEHLNMLAVIGAIFPALIMGTAFLDRRIKKQWRRSAAAVLVLWTLFLNIAFWNTWWSSARYTPRSNYDVAVRQMESIPDDASIMVPMYLAIKAKPEQRLRSFYQIPYELAQNGSINLKEDYIVFDLFTYNFYQRNYDGFLAVGKILETSKDYELVDNEHGMMLFRRKEPAPPLAP